MPCRRAAAIVLRRLVTDSTQSVERCAHWHWRLAVAAYFTVLAAYVVLRTPYLLRRVRRAIRQRREVLEERQQLAAMASRRRNDPPASAVPA